MGALSSGMPSGHTECVSDYLVNKPFKRCFWKNGPCAPLKQLNYTLVLILLKSVKGMENVSYKQFSFGVLLMVVNLMLLMLTTDQHEKNLTLVLVKACQTPLLCYLTENNQLTQTQKCSCVSIQSFHCIYSAVAGKSYGITSILVNRWFQVQVKKQETSGVCWRDQNRRISCKLQLQSGNKSEVLG